MKSIEQIAQAMYDAYNEQAGGKTWDGRPLPTWDQLGEERQQCWIAAAQKAREELQWVL